VKIASKILTAAIIAPGEGLVTPNREKKHMRELTFEKKKGNFKQPDSSNSHNSNIFELPKGPNNQNTNTAIHSVTHGS
jgi:hypothetical protein